MIELKHIDEFHKLVIHTKTRKRFWLFGEKIKVVKKYVGGCSVWKHYPSCEPCSLELTVWLISIEERDRLGLDLNQ